MENKRICSKCDIEKPLNSDYFRKDKSYKGGFRPECKECSKLRSKKYREENKEKTREYGREYYKRNAEKMREIAKKSRENNIESTKRAQKSWEEKNKERRNEYHKKWYSKNKKRKRENERKLYLKSEKYREYKLELCRKRHHRKRSVFSDFTLLEWQDCKTFFNNQCCYCGEKSDKLQQDHFIPVAKGGAYTKTNIVPSCGSCNSSKNDRDFFEWYSNQTHYSVERELKILSYLGREIKNDPLQIYR